MYFIHLIIYLPKVKGVRKGQVTERLFPNSVQTYYQVICGIIGIFIIILYVIQYF